MANFTLIYDSELKKSIWNGYPDPNYSWNGNRLVWKRTVKDEDGKDVLVKTYKDPIEIIADFKPDSKVYGVEGNIGRKAVETFGGGLKGFIWLDKISGSGEVTLPFIAPHIFIAKGDRFNPELTEIGTDSNEDNYYEVIEGKTRIHVKSFSGVGGAAGVPPTLIAHYKFNEDTASDNDDLVTDGDMDVPGSWILGDGWSIAASKANCDGTQVANSNLSQGSIGGGIIGDIYRIQFTLSNRTFGAVNIVFGGVTSSAYNSDDTYDVFIQTVNTGTTLNIRANSTFVGDIDDVSVKLLAVKDSSSNHHDGLAQQQTSDIHVTGKINGAFDFTSPDHIVIPDHDDFSPGSGTPGSGTPFSISAWVYMHNANVFAIVSKGVFTGDFDGEYRFFTAGDGTLRIRFVDADANAFIGRKYDLDLRTAHENLWLHLIATYDGGILSSGIKLYLNGVNVDDTDHQNNEGSFVAVENLGSDVRIGRYGTIYADGLIDNIAFFSKELTIDEIKILHSAGHGTEIMADLDESRRIQRRPIWRR